MNQLVSGDDPVVIKYYERNWYAKPAPMLRAKLQQAPLLIETAKEGVYKLPRTRPNAAFLMNSYSPRQMTDKALEAARLMLLANINRKVTWPEDYVYKTEPRPSQEDALKWAYDKEYFALFHKPRYGKTKIVLDLAYAWYLDGITNALLVLCPYAIRNEWIHQASIHVPSNLCSPLVVYSLDTTIRPWKAFKKQWSSEGYEEHPESRTTPFFIMVVGIESMSHKSQLTRVEEYLRQFTVFGAIDESTSIKNHKASRTKNLQTLSYQMLRRCIMTGTPVSQGLEDLYAQFNFLSETIIGQKSYYSFRNRYCIMGGFERRQIIGYDHDQELYALTGPYIHMPKPEHLIHLPRQHWQEPHILEPTEEQSKAMASLQELFLAVDDERLLTIQTVLERVLRFQQICGGLFPHRTEASLQVVPEYDEKTIQKMPKEKWEVGKLTGRNPKLDRLVAVAEDAQEPMIIWSRFILERELIIKRLGSVFGPDRVIEFTGNEEDRMFQSSDQYQFIVSGSRGGKGIDLSRASLSVFYSNTFSYMEREQQEERCRAKDKKTPVEYVDLIINCKAEKAVIRALRRKQDLAQTVMKDLAQGYIN